MSQSIIAIQRHHHRTSRSSSVPSGTVDDANNPGVLKVVSLACNSNRPSAFSGFRLIAQKLHFKSLDKPK